MQVKRVDIDGPALGDPQAGVWQNLLSRKVALTPTPVAMQGSKYILGKWKDGEFGHLGALGLQALHNGTDIAFRLEWACEPRSDTPLDNDQFADAAALLFPLSDTAPIIMGIEGAPVNIWHWRADRPKAARNNVAEGIGTSRFSKSGPTVATQAAHHHGRWFVVFRRALVATPPSAETADFHPGQTHRVAAAIWNGANAERAGLKAYSPEWVELDLEA